MAACGVNTLKNIAKAETANGTKQDDAIVTTTKKCEEPKKIQVCELATKKIITIDEKNFDSSKHSKNLKDCEEEEVKEIKVCDLTSKKIVTINEKDFDAKKHSKNLSDCNTVKYVEVCRLSDKRVVTISTKEYDANKSLYSTDLNDCKETPEEPPVVPELPTTGPGEIIASIFGAGSLTAATSAYVASRRSRA